jgi:hypothetical protein
MKKLFIIALIILFIPMLAGANDVGAIKKPILFTEAGAQNVRIIREEVFNSMIESRQEDSLYYYTSDPTGNAIGFSSAITWEAAIRFTPTELAPYDGDSIAAICWYHYDGSSPDGRVIVYDNGSQTQPGPQLYAENYTGMAQGWCRVDLASKVVIDASADMWVDVEVNDPGSGYFPVGVDAGPADPFKSDWAYEPSLGWIELRNYGLDYNWSLIAIVTKGGPSNLITWDFETGWQDWIHTNGQPFPDGWTVTDAGLHNPWTPLDAGDSTFWADDAAAGAGVQIQDSIISPRVQPDTNTNWIYYGLSYNFRNAGEWFEAGIIYYDGATWTPVQLKSYTADFGPAYDSVDVSAYKTYPMVRVYFYYDDGGNQRNWYTAIDNVGMNGTLVGIAEEEPDAGPVNFGFAPDMPNPVKGRIAISYDI